MINLKDNIWIATWNPSNENCPVSIIEAQESIYMGKVSEIPTEIAKECVEYFIQRCKYKNYNPDKLIEGIKLNGFNYAKQSIESACDKPYCIIYKK